MSAATVQQLIDAAISLANNTASSAQNALADAAAALTSPAYTTPGNFVANLPGSTYTSGTVPEADMSPFEPGDAPSKPEGLDAAAGYGREGLAPFGVDAPILFGATKPAELTPLNILPPVVGSVTMPVAPEDLSGTILAPTLTDLVVPDVPTTTLPEFTAVRPEVDLEPPTDLPEQYERNYTLMSVSMRANLEAAVDAELTKINPEYHAQMARLEAKLVTYMEGGTALPVAVEQAIYNRARDKTSAEYMKTRDTIFAEGAKRGFTIPGGGVNSSLALARQAAADNNARAAMDIAVKQAEMEQQNIQFAITQSSSLRGVILNTLMQFMGHAVQVNDQAMRYAQGILNAVVSMYETAAKLVAARIDVYKADAQVYEVRLKAALAVYDMFRAEIEALKAVADIDKAKVDVYIAQLNGQKVVVDMYAARVQASMAQVSLEKLRIDIYEAQVRAYSAEVSAKEAEWRGYVAELEGDKNLVAIYSAQAQAYSHEVDAFKAIVGADSAMIDAEGKRVEQTWRAYAEEVRAYGEQVRAKASVVDGEVSIFNGRVQAFVAQENAKLGDAKAVLQVAETAARIGLAKYESDINVLTRSAESQNQTMVAQTNALTGIAQVYAGMSSSAMAGLNVLGADVTNENTNN